MQISRQKWWQADAGRREWIAFCAEAEKVFGISSRHLKDPYGERHWNEWLDVERRAVRPGLYKPPKRLGGKPRGLSANPGRRWKQYD